MDETYSWLNNYKMEDFYLTCEERKSARYLCDAEKSFIKATSIIPSYDPWGRLDTGVNVFKNIYATIKGRDGKGTYKELHNIFTSLYATSNLISTSIEILTAHCPKIWDNSFAQEILIPAIRERYFFTNSPICRDWDATAYILGVAESLMDAVTELEIRTTTRDKLAVFKITYFEECFMCCTADTRYAIERLKIINV